MEKNMRIDRIDKVYKRRKWTLMLRLLVYASIIVAILSFMVYLAVGFMGRIEQNQAIIAELEHEMSLANARAAEIEDMAAYMQSHSFVESIARSLLNLVFRDETIFIMRE